MSRELVRLEGVEFACATSDEDTAGAGVDALGDVLGERGQVDLTRLGEGGDGEEQYAVKACRAWRDLVCWEMGSSQAG